MTESSNEMAKQVGEMLGDLTAQLLSGILGRVNKKAQSRVLDLRGIDAKKVKIKIYLDDGTVVTN